MSEKAPSFLGQFLLCRMFLEIEFVPLKKERCVHNLYDYVTLFEAFLSRALCQVIASLSVTLGQFVLCDFIQLSYLSSSGI